MKEGTVENTGDASNDPLTTGPEPPWAMDYPLDNPSD